MTTPHPLPPAGIAQRPADALRPFVGGDRDVPQVDGWDLDSALTQMISVARDRGLTGGRPIPAAVLRAARTAVGLGAFGRPPTPPMSRARIRGRLHSQLRDSRGEGSRRILMVRPDGPHPVPGIRAW